MNCALGFPKALRVTVPVIPSVEEDVYTPGKNVRPPRFPATVAVDAAPAAALYAAVNSICACAAKGFAELMLPLTKPGPPGAIPANPVIAAPGLTPRFPSTTVGPLLVTVEPAKTPNVSTVGPRAI